MSIKKNKARILFGIITKSHTELAMDEMNGLKDLGYICDGFEYGAKKNKNSAAGRLLVVLSNAFKLVKKCYKFKPDFIYLNSRVEYVAGTRDFITIFLVKYLYLRKIRFLLKSHGSDLEVFYTKKFLFSKIIFPFLKRNIRAYLFLSIEEINWVTTSKVLKKEHTFLVKNIVRNEKFKRVPNFKENLGIPENVNVLLFIGRLIEEKGIHDVLKAFKEVYNKQKSVLLIVGDGPEFDIISKKIISLGIEKHTILTGWVNEDKAAYYTSNCDMLIFPTYYPEGFPMVVFNSLAAGLPIITTPTRAAIDYLTDPENCLWVEPKNALSIEVAISTLLTDRELTNQMRINNKLKANLFTKKVVASEMADIIESLVNENYNETFLQVKKVNDLKVITENSHSH